MATGCRIDELRVDALLVAGAADTALEDVANAEFGGNLGWLYSLVLVGEGGIARDDKEPGKTRQLRRQVLGDAIGEVTLLFVLAEIVKRQQASLPLPTLRCRHS